MFDPSHSQKSTKVTPAFKDTSARPHGSRKSFIKIVTPSLQNQGLIRPLEQIKMLSCKNNRGQNILPLRDILPQTAVDSARRKQKKQYKQSLKNAKMPKQEPQPNSNGSKRNTEKTNDSLKGSIVQGARQPSPIHRLLTVSCCGKKDF